MEHIFNIIYIIELTLRLCLFRDTFFKQKANLLDIVLVAITSIQLYVLEPLATKAGGKFTLFRLLRLGRAIRVLRVVRIMSLFTELRVLVQTFISSMRALGWSM